MKLRVEEEYENVFYIDLIKEGFPNSLCEDQVLPDETILPKNRYSDPVDTRNFLSLYLEPLAQKIKKLRYIKNAYVHSPKDEDIDGMSNYVRIEFNHPIGISDEEIHNFYSYSIRFSDHKHDEAEQNKDVIESYEIVGEKPKDLPDIGWEIFMDYVDEIKAEIRQHEIDVYRFPKTTLEKKL